MPTRPSSVVRTSPLPPENFVVSIHGERSGRIVRKLVISAATADRLARALDAVDTVSTAGGELARAGADLVRAAQSFGEMIDRVSGPKRIPSRRRR